MNFDGGNFNVTWTYDMYQETLTFHLKVRTTGWVGFGFAPKAPNRMIGYDVAVGGVNSTGSSYFQVHDGCFVFLFFFFSVLIVNI